MGRKDVRTGEGELTAAIVIPFRDAAETVGRCAASLRCFFPLYANRFEVVFVDDHSTDNGPAEIKARCAWPVIPLEHGRGPGAARNEGVRHTTAPWLVFVDADCLLDISWCREVLERLLTPGVQAVAAQYKNWAGTSVFQRHAYLELKYRESGLPATVTAASSCNLAVRRDVFLQTGGFSEDPALTGAEDLEFTRRLAKICDIVWAPECGVTHIFRDSLRGYLKQQRNYARSAAIHTLRHGLAPGDTLQATQAGGEVVASALAVAATAAAVTPLFPLAVPTAAAAIGYDTWQALKQSAYMLGQRQRSAALVSLALTAPRNLAWVAGAVEGTLQELPRKFPGAAKFLPFAQTGRPG